jgi:hypothetical protein
MPCNGLEPLVIEIAWHLGAVIIVWQNLLQLDCLPWKDLEGPTLDDGRSWYRKVSTASKHESYWYRKTQQMASKMSNHLASS